METTQVAAEPSISNRPLILDGGLATQLEARGNKLDSGLWSALLLHSNPDEIQAAHMDYLRSGADIITTVSYQASIEGFRVQGIDRRVASGLLESSVELARATRDEYWLEQKSAKGNRIRPLVAASIGPYGAYLANGAEYTGDYDLDYGGLLEFHRERWRIIANQTPDLLLCETVPSFAEARALGELAASVQLPVWLSFCCRDEGHICDGTSLRACARWLRENSPVKVIGVNCVSPDWIASILDVLKSATDLPIIVYPNSGETYDPLAGSWKGVQEVDLFTRAAAEWCSRGARIIGGCCRTTPAHISKLRAELFK